MFVYLKHNIVSNETNLITGKNVIELCANMLNYSNNTIEDDTDDYRVKFSDSDGKCIIEISESGLFFAIVGTPKNEDDPITDVMKHDSGLFWEITHANVKLIEFENPNHIGQAMWDEEYEAEDDSEDEADDELEDESEEEETNYNYENNNQSLI